MLSYRNLNIPSVSPTCSLSAGELSPSPQCAFVLEDEIGMCGYALALIDAKPAAAKIQVIKCNILYFSRMHVKIKCNITVTILFYLTPPEGSKGFSAGGLSLPGYCTSAAPGH